jgi:hypothetical protein
MNEFNVGKPANDTGMKRVCYAVKASRSGFLAELKHPLKRRRDPGWRLGWGRHGD